MKINVMERVRTMGNNLNKDKKNVIFISDNKMYKYYVNSHHNRSKDKNNNDCSQTPMIFKNTKANSGINKNSLLILNIQTLLLFQNLW
jgi:hypothetical protein